MVLLLTIGDLHIPIRTHDLPIKFKKLLLPGKIGQIVCTGNVCDRETWQYLRSIAPDVRGVRGDFDEAPNLPPSLTLQHGSLKIGVIHGHQIVPLGDTESLAAAARKMDVDVLVSGATHRFEAFEFESKFFINPGSATGAFTPNWPIIPALKESDPEKNPTSPNTQEEKLQNSNDQSESDPSDQRDTEDHQTAMNNSSSSDKNEDNDHGSAINVKSESVDEDRNQRISHSSSNNHQNNSSDLKKTSSSSSSSKSPANIPHPNNTKQQQQHLLNHPSTPVPSFALLDIQGSVVVTYVYRLIDGEVKVEKIEYRKEIPITKG